MGWAVKDFFATTANLSRMGEVESRRKARPGEGAAFPAEPAEPSALRPALTPAPSPVRARAFTHLLAESLPPPPCGEDRLGRRPSEKGGAGHEAPDRRGTQSPSAAGAGPGGLLGFAPAADGRRAGFDREPYARRPPPRSAGEGFVP